LNLDDDLLQVLKIEFICLRYW